MEFTNVTLDCYGVTPTPDTEAFRIEATVTAAGELPTTALFVYSMGDPERIDADSFSRIANPQDLQNLSRDRDAAVLAGTDEYLASFASFQYGDLDVAVTAKEQVKGRINELVNRWIAYQTQFLVDTGVSQSFPSTDSTQEEALIATYTEAKEERIAAEEAVTSASLEVTSIDTALEQTKTYIPTSQQAVSDISQINNEFNAYVSDIVTEGTTAATLRTTLLATLSSSSAYFNSSLLTLTNTKTAQEESLATAKTEKIEASQLLAAAQAAEDAALAAILAVNPDFDPATV